MFYTQQMKFLDLIFTFDEIRMNLTKIEQIKNWLKPADERDVFAIRRFIKFVNFFRKFIQKFGFITALFYKLLNKNSVGDWTAVCDEAFQKFKNAIAAESVMSYFQANRKTYVKTNSSNAINDEMLS